MSETLNYNPPRTVPKPVCEPRVVGGTEIQPVIGYFYSWHQIREWELEKEMNRMVHERRSVK